MEHWEKCDSAICIDDPTNDWVNRVVWYAGESVCTKRPLTRLQKHQQKINQLLEQGLLKYPDHAWTAKQLIEKSRIGVGVKP